MAGLGSCIGRKREEKKREGKGSEEMGRGEEKRKEEKILEEKEKRREEKRATHIRKLLSNNSFSGIRRSSISAPRISSFVVCG